MQQLIKAARIKICWWVICRNDSFFQSPTKFMLRYSKVFCFWASSVSRRWVDIQCLKWNLTWNLDAHFYFFVLSIWAWKPYFQSTVIALHKYAIKNIMAKHFKNLAKSKIPPAKMSLTSMRIRHFSIRDFPLNPVLIL